MDWNERLVKVALDELGAENGEKYVRWYNAAMGSKLNLSAAWCAIFVSWCARQAGVSTKKIPNFAGCTTGRRLFQKLGSWRERGEYLPKRGDLVLFDWDGDPSLSEHVGIVTERDGKKVYTVEGNSGKTVREKSYPLGSGVILGYVNWEEEENLTKAETEKLIEEMAAKLEKKLTETLEKKLAAREPKVYDTVEEVPLWGQETVKALVADGALKGGADGKLKLSEEMLRLLVILERKEEKEDDGAGSI